MIFKEFLKKKIVYIIIKGQEMGGRKKNDNFQNWG